MHHSVKKGFSFGLTSGIITTLGMIVGLHSGTHSRNVVLGGIFLIAVADAMSDALGMHVSEEAQYHHTRAEIWTATLSTFITKFIVAMTFAIPLLFFGLSTSIIICIIWGLSLITIFSYHMARMEGIKPYRVIGEHLLTVIVVIVLTHYIGDWVGKFG